MADLYKGALVQTELGQGIVVRVIPPGAVTVRLETDLIVRVQSETVSLIDSPEQNPRPVGVEASPGVVGPSIDSDPPRPILEARLAIEALAARAVCTMESKWSG